MIARSRRSLKDIAERRLTGRKFSTLFFFLLAYLVLYPYAQHAGLPYLGFRIFGTVVTVLSVYAVSFRRSYLFIALLLSVPVMAQRIVLPRADAGIFALITVVLTFGFDLFIVFVIFRRVFMKDEPTTEAIFGALCIYLLIGFGFSGLFGMLATIQPHALYLDPTLNLHRVPDRFDLIFYSFATLTTLGATGITPISAAARSISVIEALLGVLYLAVLISRLLSAYNSRVIVLNSEKSELV